MVTRHIIAYFGAHRNSQVPKIGTYNLRQVIIFGGHSRDKVAKNGGLAPTALHNVSIYPAY